MRSRFPQADLRSHGIARRDGASRACNSHSVGAQCLDAKPASQPAQQPPPRRSRTTPPLRLPLPPSLFRGDSREPLRLLPRFRLGAAGAGAADLRAGRGRNLQRDPEHQVRRRAHEAGVLDPGRRGADVHRQRAELSGAAGARAAAVSDLDWLRCWRSQSSARNILARGAGCSSDRSTFSRRSG